jgi:hypothetical protein
VVALYHRAFWTGELTIGEAASSSSSTSAVAVADSSMALREQKAIYMRAVVQRV